MFQVSKCHIKRHLNVSRRKQALARDMFLPTDTLLTPLVFVVGTKGPPVKDSKGFKIDSQFVNTFNVVQAMINDTAIMIARLHLLVLTMFLTCLIYTF